MTEQYCLLRYDTECQEVDVMTGFLDKVLEVHQRDQIPVTLYCTGRTLELQEDRFKAFWKVAKDIPYIDVQDHSYSHIGLGYEQSVSTEELRADYEKSFAIHERVFGKRPTGVARCGVGKLGKSLKGFDANEKTRADLDMLAELGMTNHAKFLSTAEKGQFCNYGELGHPDIMGFVSQLSDTSWLFQRDWEEGLSECFEGLAQQKAAGHHGAVIMHDWCQWKCAPDKELTIVSKVAAKARELGFTLATAEQCYNNKNLWT